jgi:peroxiredoxin
MLSLAACCSVVSCIKGDDENAFSESEYLEQLLQPGTEAPDIEVPASDSSGGETSGSEASGNDTTESETSGADTSKIEIKTYDGSSFSLRSLRGSYVVLEFWASWCPDCQRELPNFQRIFNEYAPKGVRFVGFSFDDDETEWKKAIQEYGLSYSHLSEFKRMRDSKVVSLYHVKWIPTMYLIGPDGKILLGTIETTELDKALASINLE